MLKLILILAVALGLKANATVSDKVIAGTIVNGCFEQGNIKETNRSFDIGIAGEGWIPIQNDKGGLVYTRYGSFGMDPNGDLIHLASGLPLVTMNADGKPEKINVAQYAWHPFFKDTQGRKAHLNQMFFTETGTLEGFYSDGQSAHLATLKLAAFENQSKLQLLNAKTHLFQAPKAVGEIAYGSAETAPFGKIFARALEEVPADRYTKKCN